MRSFSLLAYCSIALITASVQGLSWKQVMRRKYVKLFVGNITDTYKERKGFTALSLDLDDQKHILHNILTPMPIPDNSVDIYQSEDVFEHVAYDQLPSVINEIHRVLKPGGLLRISVPDYRCDILYDRCLKDDQGKILFDAGGGGKYVDGQVVEGGHVWFPVIELVRSLLEKTLFATRGTIEYLHYYDESGFSHMHPIDYKKGFIKRVPDHDVRVQNPVRVMSIVVDAYKGEASESL